MPKPYGWVLVAFLTLATSAPASAFDGRRTGFFVDLAVGPGFTAFDHDARHPITYLSPHGDTLAWMTTLIGPRERRTRAGLSTSVALGFGLNERVVVSYMNRLAWYDSEMRSPTFAGLGGISATWFASEATPGLYVGGGLGLGFSNAIPKDTAARAGLGLAGFVGYELRRPWAIELSFVRSSMEQQVGPAKAWALSSHITLVWRGY